MALLGYVVFDVTGKPGKNIPGYLITLNFQKNHEETGDMENLQDLNEINRASQREFMKQNLIPRY